MLIELKVKPGVPGMRSLAGLEGADGSNEFLVRHPHGRVNNLVFYILLFTIYNKAGVNLMGELLKLKVSPKGQITLPKRVRKEMVIKDFIYLEVKGNKAILKPVTFEEEFEDLIVRELEYEGYSKVQIDEMLPEKKKDLSKAILEELESRKDEETITHEELIKELE